MKWKGRRQSTNVIDNRDEISALIQNDKTRYTGGVIPKDAPKMTKKDKEEIHKNAKVRRTLNELDEAGKTPIPTPKPSQKRERVKSPINAQVTPGKWTTK